MPIDILIYEEAKKWGKLPHEIEAIPATKFLRMLEIESIENEFGK